MSAKRFFGVPVNFAYKYFGNLGDSLAGKLNLWDLLQYANFQISPIGYCSVFIFYLLFISLPFSLALFFMMIILKLNLIYVPFAFSPIIVCFSFFSLYPRFKAHMRSVNLTAEFPFLATYIGMMSAVGISPYKAFERLSRQNILKASKREGEIVVREKVVFSREPISALENFLKYNPSKVLRDYLSTYLRIIKTGGDAISYLVEYSFKMVEWMRLLLKEYSENVKLYGDLMIALFIFIPVGFFSIVFLMAIEQGIFFMKFYGLLLAPLCGLGLLFIVDSEQFKFPQKYDEYFKLSGKFMLFMIVVDFLLIFSNFVPDMKWHLVFAFTIIFSLLPSAILYEFDAKSCRDIESSLPSFLRDIAESRRIGLSIERALKIASTRSYGSSLDRIVKRLNSLLTNSLTPIERAVDLVISDVKSWYARAIFWLFKEALVTGGGSSETFNILAKFSEDYIEVKHKVSRELKVYYVIGYVASIMLLFILTQLIKYGFIPSFYVSQNLPGSLGLPIQSVSRSILNELLSSSFLTVIVVSCLMGLIVGKISNGSIVGGFKHSIICVLITVLGIETLGWLW